MNSFYVTLYSPYKYYKQLFVDLDRLFIFILELLLELFILFLRNYAFLIGFLQINKFLAQGSSLGLDGGCSLAGAAWGPEACNKNPPKT